MSLSVIALMGLPGAGKSTLAALLAQHTGMAVISRDQIRSEDFPQLGYSTADKAILNDAVFAAVPALLGAGRSCIVDGMSFARVSERERLAAIADSCGVGFMAVLMECPVEVAMRRVRQSAHPAADRTAQRVQEVAMRFEPVNHVAVRLDALSSPTQLLEQILRCF